MSLPPITGQILPPSEPIADGSGNVTPPWYRYLVARKRITDQMTGTSGITIDPATPDMPNTRQIVVDAPITAVDGGPGGSFTLGLADSGVTADDYGDATHLVVLAIDAKGRVTSASEVALNSDNVAEGVTNLYFTNTRARSAISGAGQVSYNSGTGVIDTTGASSTTANPITSLTVSHGIVTAVASTAGYTGTKTPVTSITVANGIVTAVS